MSYEKLIINIGILKKLAQQYKKNIGSESYNNLIARLEQALANFNAHIEDEQIQNILDFNTTNFNEEVIVDAFININVPTITAHDNEETIDVGLMAELDLENLEAGIGGYTNILGNQHAELPWDSPLDQEDFTPENTPRFEGNLASLFHDRAEFISELLVYNKEQYASYWQIVNPLRTILNNLTEIDQHVQSLINNFIAMVDDFQRDREISNGYPSHDFANIMLPVYEAMLLEIRDNLYKTEISNFYKKLDLFEHNIIKDAATKENFLKLVFLIKDSLNNIMNHNGDAALLTAQYEVLDDIMQLITQFDEIATIDQTNEAKIEIVENFLHQLEAILVINGFIQDLGFENNALEAINEDLDQEISKKLDEEQANNNKVKEGLEERLKKLELALAKYTQNLNDTNKELEEEKEFYQETKAKLNEIRNTIAELHTNDDIANMEDNSAIMAVDPIDELTTTFGEWHLNLNAATAATNNDNTEMAKLLQHLRAGQDYSPTGLFQNGQFHALQTQPLPQNDEMLATILATLDNNLGGHQDTQAEEQPQAHSIFTTVTDIAAAGVQLVGNVGMAVLMAALITIEESPVKY